MKRYTLDLTDGEFSALVKAVYWELGETRAAACCSDGEKPDPEMVRLAKNLAAVNAKLNACRGKAIAKEKQNG